MIEIEGLTKRFGTMEAVCNLSLRIPRGHLFGFLGPNGAGKTTTIKMLCGLLRPTRGTVRINGVNIEEDPVAVRRITGYIPDSPYLYDRLSVTEFFEFTGDLYRLDPRRVAEQRDALFEQFSLQDQRHALIKELSHGYRQRLVYAATFLHDPRVLFIDEPFVGLDPYSIRLIRDLLKEKTRAGMTVFLTTHILALAEDMADSLGIIAGGRLVARGTLDELKGPGVDAARLEDVFLELTRSQAAGGPPSPAAGPPPGGTA
jgi:ABC-2 type transport system ATP-binding protein